MMKEREKVISFLGKGTEFDGKLTFRGTVRIDGHFKGEISCDGNVIVGEEAVVEADMHVSYIVITGEVRGNITADQRVDIRASAKVFGNIRAPSVVMDQGALFWGETQMHQTEQAGKAKSALIGSDEYASGPPPNLTSIYGIVTDQKTGNPIKSAKVKCKGDGTRTTETNASGYYELTNLKDGDWKVKIEADGYRKRKAHVEISSGEACEQNFELQLKKKEWL
jgi:cytoskeletal protein CcmA (bactofilin family)